MVASHNETRRALIFTVGQRICAIHVENVAEIMRPLPVQPVVGMPAPVRGLSVIRGAPMPVLDMRMLLDGLPGDDCSRFVVLKMGDRSVAITVDRVIGMQGVAASDMHELPPLLRTASAALVSAVGAVDRQLLVVLDTARLVPADFWTELASAEAR